MSKNTKELKANAELLASVFKSVGPPSSRLAELLLDLFTSAEIEDFVQRWSLLRLLHQGSTQRVVAKELGISISKVSRGAKVLEFGSKGLMAALEKGQP